MEDLPLELLSLTTKTLSDARLLELRNQLHAAQKRLEVTWVITYVRNQCDLHLNTHNISVHVVFNLRKGIDWSIQNLKYKLRENGYAQAMFGGGLEGVVELKTKKGIVKLLLYESNSSTSIILPPKCAEELITTLLSIYSQ